MSPIFGLTDTPKAFMKLGQIRKGDKVEAKRRDGSTYTKPVDLDYFRVTFQDWKGRAGIEQTFRAAYGDKPQELNIRFPEPDINQVWDANYECYKQGGLIAKAGSNDKGLYWQFYRDPDDGEVLVRDGQAVGERGNALIAKPIDVTKPIYSNQKGEGVFLEPVGRLKVVIPEVAHLAVGYFVFQPGSPRDIRNISAELAAYESIAKQYGKSICGIPFVLRRRPEEVTVNIDGKLSKKISYVVHIDAGGEWGRKAISVIEQLALPDVVEAEFEEVIEESHAPSAGPEWNDFPALPEPEYEPEPVKPEPVKDDSGKEFRFDTDKIVKAAAEAWNVKPSEAIQGLVKMQKAGTIPERLTIQKAKSLPKP